MMESRGHNARGYGFHLESSYVNDSGKRGKAARFRRPRSLTGGTGWRQTAQAMVRRFRFRKHQVGLWILLGTIVMLFGGLSSAYIVLPGRPDWQNIIIPSILWLNTAILLASSATIEAARRSLSYARLGSDADVAADQRGIWFRVSGRTARRMAAAGRGRSLFTIDAPQLLLLCINGFARRPSAGWTGRDCLTL